jgi:hypothetical protein
VADETRVTSTSVEVLSTPDAEPFVRVTSVALEVLTTPAANSLMRATSLALEVLSVSPPTAGSKQVITTTIIT